MGVSGERAEAAVYTEPLNPEQTIAVGAVEVTVRLLPGANGWVWVATDPEGAGTYRRRAERGWPSVPGAWADAVATLGREFG